MRAKLKRLYNCRAVFVGRFSRFGTKREFGFEKRTVLLVDIKDDAGNVVADHLWLNLTKGFQRLHLKHGDQVTFSARVRPYDKGYVDRYDFIDYRSTDYKLAFPTKITKV